MSRYVSLDLMNFYLMYNPRKKMITEERHIVKDFDSYLTSLASIIHLYRFKKFDNLSSEYNDTEYRKTKVTKYMYNPITCKFIDTTKNLTWTKDKMVNWHRLVLKLYKNDKQYPEHTTMAVVRNAFKYKDELIYKPITSSLVRDDIVIEVYLDNLKDSDTEKKRLDEIKEFLRHELTHVKGIWNNNKYHIYNTIKARLSQEKLENDFIIRGKNFIDGSQYVFDSVPVFCYYGTKHEQEAYSNQLYQIIIDLSSEELEDYIERYKTYQYIITGIIYDNDDILFLKSYETFYESYEKGALDNLIPLMIGYYFKKHKITFKNPYPEYVTKEFIQNCLDNDINPKNKGIKTTVQGIMLKLRFLYREYCNKLFMAGYEALIDRGIVANRTDYD